MSGFSPLNTIGVSHLKCAIIEASWSTSGSLRFLAALVTSFLCQFKSRSDIVKMYVRCNPVSMPVHARFVAPSSRIG